MSNQQGGIVDGISNAVSGAAQTVSDGASYVANTITGNTHEAARKADQEVLKSDQSTIGQKFDAAGGAISHGFQEATDKGQAKVDKESAKH